MTCLLLSDDLIFTTRIAGTGQDVGVLVRTVPLPERLLAAAREAPPAAVIVDLAIAGLNIAEFVAELKKLTPPPRVVAYGPHVDTEKLHAAREAGCDLVMARSKFVNELPTALAEWAKPIA